MIFDESKNLDFYRTLGIEGRYAKAIDFLQSHDLKALENGKYEIDGKNVYANVMTYTTLPWEKAAYEAHQHYTDIQYIISGFEAMSYAPVEELVPTGPYNPDKDVIKFDNSVPGLAIPTKECQYCIFFPWDGHKPKPMYKEPCEVKKIVVKIKED